MSVNEAYYHMHTEAVFGASGFGICLEQRKIKRGKIMVDIETGKKMPEEVPESMMGKRRGGTEDMIAPIPELAPGMSVMRREFSGCYYPNCGSRYWVVMDEQDSTAQDGEEEFKEIRVYCPKCGRTIITPIASLIEV